MKPSFWIVLGLLVALLGAGMPGGPAVPARAMQPAPDDGAVNPDLLALAEEYEDYQNNPALAGLPFDSANHLMRISGDLVAVDVAGTDPVALEIALRDLGMQQISRAGHMVSGLLPLDHLDDLAQVPDLRLARPSYALRMVGQTTSQGVQAMAADQGRARYEVDGSGVSVGTLSNSYDCDLDAFTRAADDVASGDLPPDVIILKELTGNPSCDDEGRAMMQLIHDIAPGARQLFYTAFISEPDFANGIRQLAAAGADVIVDDIIYLSEPMFQDGFIAQAVDDVVAQGVPYFSSAGNNGRMGYQSAYRRTAPQTVPVDAFNRTYRPHDFDPGPGQDVYQQLLVPAGATISIVLQWDENFFSLNGNNGSRNDLDILLFSNPPGPQPIAGGMFSGGATDNTGRDPLEILRYTNRGISDEIANIFIGKRDDGSIDPGFLKYVIFRGNGGVINEYSDSSNNSTIYGHANATGALAVGAADYRQTPAFGVNPPQLESFSSPGPTPIYLNPDGSRKSATELRAKPNFVAPDGTNTTFFPGPPNVSNDPENDGFPNFFGTSAAAPHAAAVAALMLQLRPELSPAQIAQILSETAIDMESPGYDRLSGFGLIQADQALAQLGDIDLTITEAGPGTFALLEESLTYTVTLRNTGGASARTTIFTETIPPDFNMLAADNSQSGVCDTSTANLAVCDLGQVDAGAAVTSTFTVSPTVLGTFNFTSTVSSMTPESLLEDNEAVRSLNVVPFSTTVDLDLSLAASAAAVERNDPLTYTLSISNSGPANADAITLTKELTPGYEFVRAEGEDWACSLESSIIRCSRPGLTATLVSTVTVQIQAPPRGGLLVSNAQVTSRSAEIELSNNTAQLITAVRPRIFLPVVRSVP